MARATIVTDEARTVDATVDGDRLLLHASKLPEAIGWALKPEGLCRDDVCVPVRDRAAVVDDHDRVDVAAAAAALGRPAVVDTGAGIAAIAQDAETRRRALDGLEAPNFALPDLDGRTHQLDEWRGRKKLLVAFSTW
jgi:hypothetical protein